MVWASAAFLALVLDNLEHDWTVNRAYEKAADDFRAQGKRVPDKKTCYNWLRQEGRISGAKKRNRAARPTDPTAEPEEAEAADLSDGAGTEAPDPDYTRRLEMMVRLYRTRSEAAVDAACDRLLPELAEEE